jgi:hypothetical protein
MNRIRQAWKSIVGRVAWYFLRAAGVHECLDPRRHGWLIIGSANGVAFDGYIGQRWK